MEMDIEKRTLRRITWRIVPFIMLLYLIAYIDRVNIGFAALTMKEDLGFTASVLGFGAGIFFWVISYLKSHPTLFCIKSVPASGLLESWWLGVDRSRHGICRKLNQLLHYAILLGVAEAGFFPALFCT